MSRLWDGAIVALVVGGVLAITGSVTGSLQLFYVDGRLPDTRAMTLAHHAFNALWLVCSPLGYFAVKFARSLRADLQRVRGRSKPRAGQIAGTQS